MGIPKIVTSGTERCQAITDMMESVALEQAALAHVLNAEGEKLQKVMQTATTIDRLLSVNRSAQTMVDSVARLEMILGSKLGLMEDCLCTNSCPTVTTTCPPVKVTITTTGGSVVEVSPHVYSALIAPGSVMTISTNPLVTVTAAALAAGFTFAGNQLTAPATMIPFQQYANLLYVGENGAEGNCQFAITINAVYANA